MLTPTPIYPATSIYIIVNMVEVGQVVEICAAVLTASLIILNYIILKGSMRQNQKSIELYEKNLKVSEETLQLNRFLLEENKKMIEVQEMGNRPKFAMKQHDGFRFDPVTGRPHLYLENIGGKEALVKKIHIVIMKNLISVVKDEEINKNIKPGAPLNIETDLPASVFEYAVQRKDGDPVKSVETIFFSVSCVIEYTHIDGADADPFTDTLGFKIGNDYMNNDEFNYAKVARRSTKEDTWHGLLGTGADMPAAEEEQQLTEE